MVSNSSILGDLSHITSFSVREDGTYTFDDSAMRIFRPPHPESPVELDGEVQRLKSEQPSRHFQHPERLDCILDACISTGQEHVLLGANVITWRGMIARIMVGAKFDTVILNVSLIDGRLYVEEHDPNPDEQVWRDDNLAMWEAFWNTYTESPSSNKGEYGHVVTRTLNDFTLLYGGSIHAVTDNVDGDTQAHPVQLKTRKHHRKNDPKERARWYIQSYLLGVPEIYVGHRDDEHRIVRTQVREVSSLEIPMADKNDRAYKALSELREKVMADASTSDDIIWKTTIQEGSILDLQQLDPAAAEKVKRAGPDSSVDRIGIVPRRIVEGLRTPATA